MRVQTMGPHPVPQHAHADTGSQAGMPGFIDLDLGEQCPQFVAFRGVGLVTEEDVHARLCPTEIPKGADGPDCG